jgi:hypothetical protein
MEAAFSLRAILRRANQRNIGTLPLRAAGSRGCSAQNAGSRFLAKTKSIRNIWRLKLAASTIQAASGRKQIPGPNRRSLGTISTRQFPASRRTRSSVLRPFSNLPEPPLLSLAGTFRGNTPAHWKTRRKKASTRTRNSPIRRTAHSGPNAPGGPGNLSRDGSRRGRSANPARLSLAIRPRLVLALRGIAPAAGQSHPTPA